MSDNIQFDTDNQLQREFSNRNNAAKQPSAMAAWLMKHGYTKSASGAEVVLVAVVLINVIIIYVLLTYFL